MDSSFSDSVTTNFDETKIAKCIIEGKEEELRDLLDKGLSPDYVFTQDITVNDFLCPKEISLLLLTLQSCVKYNSSSSLYTIIALLLERGVDLEKECFGLNPLSYVCENKFFFLEEIILCLLTSVSKQRAFSIISKISNIENKGSLEKLLNSSTSLFQFDPNMEITQKPLVQNVSNIGEGESKISSLSKEQIFCSFTLQDVLKYDEKNKKLLLKIKEYDHLEKILGNSLYLQKCDQEVQSKTEGHTFFSFLISEIEDLQKKHDLCLLFLKYGYTHETIVYKDMNMAEFLCNLRRKTSFKENGILQGILMETLCVIFFSFKEGFSINYILNKLFYDKDKKFLYDFFIDKKTGKFSKCFVSFIDLLEKDNDYNYIYLIKGFLDLSLILNKNAITEKKWDIDYIFPILNHTKKKLCNLSIINCNSQRKRKNLLFDLLESLLKASIHENSLNQEKKIIYNSWFKKQLFLFKNLEIKVEALTLIKKYWEPFFDIRSQMILSENLKNIIVKSENQGSNGKITSFQKRKNSEKKEKNLVKKIKLDLQFGSIALEQQNSFEQENTFSYINDSILSLIQSSFEQNEFDIQLESIEKILQNASLLKKYDQEVRTKISGETLFSFLISKVKDVYKRHNICLLFLKYGYLPDTIVSQDITMVNFLCSLRRRSNFYENQNILMETLCSIFFFFKEETDIKPILENLTNLEDKRILTKFFVNEKTGIFSKSSINFICLIKNDFNFTFKYLLRGFLEASLITNKNVITEKKWDVDYIFPFLKIIKGKLCLFYKEDSKDQERRKKTLIRIFEDLLKATIHKNSLSEEKAILYSSWIQQESFVFKSTEIKEKVFLLLEKYWGSFFNKNENNNQQICSKNILISNTFIDVINESKELIEKLNIGDFNFLEEILKNSISLKEYDQKIDSKAEKETFFSFLIYKVKDVYKRHNICLLFLKYGYTAETIVSQNISMAEFLCNLRRNKIGYSPEIENILIETLCAVFFFFKNDFFVKSALEKLVDKNDKRQMQKFFTSKETNCFSKNFIDFTDLIKKDPDFIYKPLFKGFLDSSLAVNKNMITEEPWDIKYVFPMLNTIKKKLYDLYILNNERQKKKKEALINLLEDLLKATMHENSLNEETIVTYNSWFQSNLFFFKNDTIKKEVLMLIQRHWNSILNATNKAKLTKILEEISIFE